MNKPSEFAVMIGIFSLVIITAGFFISSGATHGGEKGEGPIDEYVSDITYGVNGTNGLSSTGIAIEQGVLSTNVSASTSTSGVGDVFVQGWNSLKKLSYSFTIVNEAMSDTGELFGLDPIYWIIISSMLLITFAVVMWTWVIGGGVQ